MPEIHSCFIPQGIDYLEEENLFLVSGYDNKGVAKLYLISEENDYREISIIDDNGKAFINHAGGVGTFGEYVYIAGCDKKCYVLSRDEIVNENTNSAKIVGSFDTFNNADFCYVKDDRLYVGEYAHSIKYITDSTHHITTPAGDENKAIITVFELSANDFLGLGNDRPVEIYSTTGIVQGMCITDDGKLVLSTSALYATSNLYVYDQNKAQNDKSDTFSISEESIPLYYLDNYSLDSVINAPPKSEGLFYDGNKIFIVFEAASNKFVLGKFIGGEYVYSIELA